MVRVCRVVPKEWIKYTPVGVVIPKTRFIVFKTPLNDRMTMRMPKSERFNVSSLFRTLAERGEHLGLVIDLTDTDRYYDKNDIEGMCIEYNKINSPGRGFIEREECVEGFFKAIKDYSETCEDTEALIGVHCTNGVNRSGYLICRFLIEKLGWSSHEAIDAFEKARGHAIEKGSYIQALHRAAKDHRTKKVAADSESDSEEQRRKSKKAKRKRDRESVFGAEAMGNMIQQFLGQIGETAEQMQAAAATAGSGSGYGSPAVSGHVDSPAQQHWAYQQHKRAKIAEDHSPYPDGVNGQVGQEEDEYDEEDGQGEEDQDNNGVEEEGAKQSRSARRRARKARGQKMLAVMKRGRFHEIQAMQQEFLQARGS